MSALLYFSSFTFFLHKTMSLPHITIFRLLTFFVKTTFLPWFFMLLISKVFFVTTIFHVSSEISTTSTSLNADSYELINSSTLYSSFCPSRCSCTPSLPPSILPGLWDVPPRRPLPDSSPDLVSLAVSCADAGLRQPPLPPQLTIELHAKIHRLIEMDLSRNNLLDLHDHAFQLYPHLKQLKLSGNGMKHVAPLALLGTPLQALLLDNNTLDYLPYDLQLPPLEELSLEANHFASIPPPITKLLTLRALNLAKNQLRSVREDDLSYLSNLVTLSLNNNLLDSVHPQALAALPSLENLDMSYNRLQAVPSAILLCPSITRLLLNNNRIVALPAGVFEGLRNLQQVTLLGNRLHSVHPNAFAALPSLTRIILQEVSNLTVFPQLSGSSSIETLRIDRSSLRSLPRGFCSHVPALRSLNLHHNKLAKLPHLHKCHDLRLLDLSHNQIDELGEGELLHQSKLHDLLLQHNAIRVIRNSSFRGLRNLQILNLENNQISVIQPDAFLPLIHLEDINLGNNQLKEFPALGLEHIVTLKVHHNRQLKVFPGPERFSAAHTLVLSYAYHCCAFINYENTAVEGSNDQKIIENVIYDVDKIGNFDNVDDMEHFDKSLLLNMTDIWSPTGKDHFVAANGSDILPNLRVSHYQEYSLKPPSPSLKGSRENSSSPLISDDLNNTFGALWAKLAADFPPRVIPDQVLPGWGATPISSASESSSRPRPSVQCIPMPSPFMPCRDLFDWWTLRCGVWIVFLLALLGNGTVVVVLCFARSKMDVPRFLVANLALADFFMGIYLGFLAVIDASTLGEFRMYAIPWQMSTGCQVAGFIGVFSSELSVYTLTVITLERNYAITHAMHLNKRLSLKHAAYVMLGGWLFAGTMAVLPITGVSDYRKFAVCLPFETDGSGLLYVVSLMFINGTAFLILMICYMKIYCSIRGSQAWNSNDSRIAKRMALLVFTDFICLAPIAFFSLTAAFGLHLISLEEAKVFTVFVLPFNSCCNPFLYALLTKQFKKDCVILCKTIEESRVTRGIGRCRHSSNFSNRQTPANTNSAVEQSSKGNGEDCNCQSKKKQVPPTLTQRITISLFKFFYCHHRRDSRSNTSEYAYEQDKLGNQMLKNTLTSSENYSSSYSENYKRGKIPLSLRLLDRRRQSSWYLTRKSSQESNLSSSRNDSSATTASTSTWRISRSSVSSDVSSGASRVLGKNDSQLSIKLGSFRERKTEPRASANPTEIVMQHAPVRSNSLKRAKPKLQRQTALEKESYLSNKFGSNGSQCVKTNNKDNLPCVYEQDSFEEDDMTQVTAFLTPTYRLAGLAVGFIPRKLSTISSESVSVNKEVDVEIPDGTLCPEKIFETCRVTNDADHKVCLPNSAAAQESPGKCKTLSLSTSPHAVHPHHSAYSKYNRYPSESNLCKSFSHQSCLAREHMRRVVTMPVMLTPVGGTSDDFNCHSADKNDDVIVDSNLPVGLLETHFPLEEAPNEQDPLL